MKMLWLVAKVCGFSGRIHIILPLANLTTNHRNVAAATIAQAPHLTAMLDMTGTRKKEACGKLDGFKKQVGEAGLMQLLKCAGDFPKAYKDAKAFCGTGGAGSGSGSSKKAGSGLTLRSAKSTIEVCVC